MKLEKEESGRERGGERKHPKQNKKKAVFIIGEIKINKIIIPMIWDFSVLQPRFGFN